MRKLICSALVLVLVLTAGIPTVTAANHRKKGKHQVQKCNIVEQECGFFVDEDQNGICDNGGSKGFGCGKWIDEDGNGICDNRDTKVSGCKNWIDEDEDGICDIQKNQCDNNGICQYRINKYCRRK